MLAIVVLFTRKKPKGTSLTVCDFTALPCFPVSDIFLGFSNVNNRWGYIYVVIVSFILAESLDKMRDLSGKELGIMTAITGLYGLVNAFSDKLFVPSIYGAFGLLAAIADYAVLIK